MTRKAIQDLEVGDLVALEDGVARVASKERSRLFKSPGGCWRFDFTVTDGPHKGEKIRDQHYPGTNEVELIT